MKLSVTQKFVGILVAMLLSCSAVIYFVATHNYSKTLTNVLHSTITSAQGNLEEIINAKRQDTKQTAKIGAQYSGLAEALATNDHATVQKIAQTIMQQTGYSILTITDAKGQVIARAHTNSVGDNISNQEIIVQALRGNSFCDLVVGAKAVSMRASSPIMYDNTVVGTFSLGDSLSNPSYIDWLASLLNVRVTFFKDDTRLMTTIKDKQGNRIINSKLNNPHIENQVLNQGKTYFGQSTIMGEKYLAAYWPARDHGKKIIGMWFIGQPIHDVLQAENTAQYYTLISASITLCIALILAIIIGLRFTAPINKIAQYAQKVANNEENTSLHIHSKDEFGILAESLKSMVEKLKEQSFWYSSVLNALPINVSVTDMDKNWLFVNTAGLAGSGKKLEDILGLPCHTRGGNLCNTPDCGITRLEQGQAEAINTMPNGTVMQMRLSYLHNSHGAKIGHVEVGLNITEQEKIKKEAAIATENMRLALIQQIESVVLTLDEAAQHLFDSVSSAEEDARNTASHMLDVTAAIGEMENTIHEVAKNASQAAMGASNTQSQAQDGQHIVQLIVNDILGVQNSSNNLKVDMEKLSEHANSIGAILNIIRDIADQTNLLALNAAIEAARAGEAGRGFAVVADEVRKLAEKTMDATKEVETAIHIIQERTVESSKTMDTTVKAVHKATEEVQTAGNTLNDIVSLSMTTADEVSVIATAAEEQAATTGNISRTVTDSNELAQKLATSMEETSHTVRKVSSQAGMLRDILADMKK